MWNICYSGNDDSVYMLYDTTENPKFYLCERLVISDANNNKIIGNQFINEVVSVDANLFQKRNNINYTQSIELQIPENQQILCVMCMLDDNGNVNNPQISETVIQGFLFCGFDLADNWEISVLTNCAKNFEKVFTYKDLNEFGLLPNYYIAKEIQSKLMEEYPDEEHAYCALFAIWRRI